MAAYRHWNKKGVASVIASVSCVLGAIGLLYAYRSINEKIESPQVDFYEDELSLQATNKKLLSKGDMVALLKQLLQYQRKFNHVNAEIKIQLTCLVEKHEILGLREKTEFLRIFDYLYHQVEQQLSTSNDPLQSYHLTLEDFYINVYHLHNDLEIHTLFGELTSLKSTKLISQIEGAHTFLEFDTFLSICQHLSNLLKTFSSHFSVLPSRKYPNIKALNISLMNLLDHCITQLYQVNFEILESTAAYYHPILTSNASFQVLMDAFNDSIVSISKRHGCLTVEAY